MQQSYYHAPLGEFLRHSEGEILSTLTSAHHFALEETQRDAWLTQIAGLKVALAGFEDGHIHFEFMIPRMGKRADCVLFLRGWVFVLEFKVGASRFENAARTQVHDYALDLKNFHLGSHELPLIPVVIATQAAAPSAPSSLNWAPDGVAEPLNLTLAQLKTALSLATQYAKDSPVTYETWLSSGYRPTPTIVEAARTLYASHQVKALSTFDAGAQNLAATHEVVAAIIEDAKVRRRKAICFITGVPGAGKTLAGLNLATQRASHTEEHAVFLSGNGPLVTVLREALARDQAQRESIKKGDADRHIRAFIQNIHHFRDEYVRDTQSPLEKVVIFDEAQRAWSREQASKFMKQKGLSDFDASEPDFLIGVMNRHSDWCVIICLIGGGQEINTGEAGLSEWLSALKTHYPHWDVHASAALNDRDYTLDALSRTLLAEPQVQKHQALHLAMSMRSFRAETLNRFVSTCLHGEVEQAYLAYQELAPRYPMYLTRDLEKARQWLRKVARGSERYGFVASSGALRLRPEGLHVKAKIEPEHWLLNSSEDVRSCYALEEVATEFDIQGLELDWVALAWDADFRWNGSCWETFKFRGTKWQQVNMPQRQRYLLNAYRVLLTRARQGLIIYVPKGDSRDLTRSPAFYDGTYEMLRACGVPELAE